jgi:putative hydrolase of the HAD superfamily
MPGWAAQSQGSYSGGVPLLLLDLDNTLIDRAGALRRWAAGFAAEIGASGADVEWLITEDRDGLEPRDRLAVKARQRLGLTGGQEAMLLAELRRGFAHYLELDPAVPNALDLARAAGWVPVVLTNGTVYQQELKLRHTGLDQHVAGWVISEEAGTRKPDPAIFRQAAQRASQELAGAWMIGDSAAADIAGARGAGISSIWLHRHRTWSGADFRPTRIADTCAAAIAFVTQSPARL